MKIIKSVSEMQDFARATKQRGERIGFVPTMGFLHEGHCSLIRKAREEADILVVSIFVNPSQFGPSEDFNQYPRDLARDTELCREHKVDVLFCPNEDEVYGNTFQTWILVTELSQGLCGQSRPDHFKGVATVVAKLFNITLPDDAYFGLKDYQQVQLLRQMVEDLNFPVRIHALPIVREADGLALSSRNAYLSADARQKALVLPRTLQKYKNLLLTQTCAVKDLEKIVAAELVEYADVAVDYVSIVSPESLKPMNQVGSQNPGILAVAIRVGSIRLIDNVMLGLADEGGRYGSE